MNEYSSKWKLYGSAGFKKKYYLMPTRTYILACFLFCLACTNTKEEKSGEAASDRETEIEFEKTKWRKKQDKDYPFREGMLDDLISSKKLKGLKRDEIFDLLGEPDRVDSSYLFYRIAQKRIGFFPLHTKTLVIKLANDSTTNWVRIHE